VLASSSLPQLSSSVRAWAQTFSYSLSEFVSRETF
jgi:hypothetical protein